SRGRHCGGPGLGGGCATARRARGRSLSGSLAGTVTAALRPREGRAIMKLRTLIADDEPLARRRLRRLLRAAPCVELVGECGDGVATVAAVERERPDLLLLDVQMPELDGFGVLEALSPARRPVTIFVTAYDSYPI